MHSDIVSKLGFSDAFRNMYLVDDLNVEDCKVLFILESPHKDEIVAKHPVAGDSGISMTGVLSRCNLLPLDLKDLPFGLIIRKNKSIFGLMNVSQIPLQSQIYSQSCPLPVKYQKAFKTIRGNPSSTARNDSCAGDVETLLLSDYSCRLEKITGDKLLIPCGIFAQCFTKKIKMMLPWYDGIPHPSYKNWEKQKYSCSIQRMIRDITQHIK